MPPRMTTDQIMIIGALNPENEDIQTLVTELHRERALTEELVKQVLTLALHEGDDSRMHQDIEQTVTILKIHGLD